MRNSSGPASVTSCLLGKARQSRCWGGRKLRQATVRAISDGKAQRVGRSGSQKTCLRDGLAPDEVNGERNVPHILHNRNQHASPLSVSGSLLLPIRKKPGSGSNPRRATAPVGGDCRQDGGAGQPRHQAATSLAPPPNLRPRLMQIQDTQECDNR